MRIYALVLVLAVVLAACGTDQVGDTTTSPDTTPVTTTTTTPTTTTTTTTTTVAPTTTTSTIATTTTLPPIDTTYADLDAIRQALDAGGWPCPQWDLSDDPAPATGLVHCHREVVIATFPDHDAAEFWTEGRIVRVLMPFKIDGAFLIGENWVADCSGQCENMQPILGGEYIPITFDD